MTASSLAPSRFSKFWLPILLASFLAISPRLGAQTADIADFAVPADMSNVHFYLITVDVGDSVWDNFGHTALRVRDESNNTDTVFNWGYFSFGDGVVAFSWNFFKGIMNYSLVTNSPRQEFAMYRAQERTVWQDRINLTNPQKARLYRRLLWNLEPANVQYPYQYFFDNCTTKVRDYLDEALVGSISQQYTGDTAVTFREQVQAHYESVGLVGFSLEILMNSNIDRNMTEWEDMFLPLKLRERLMGVRSDVAENGEQLMLLSDPQIFDSYPPPTADSNPYQIASLVLVAPVLFLGLMLKRIPQSYFATHSRIGFKAAGINFRILGLLGLLTAVFSGVYGILMLGSWFVSDHVDTHHNINLLLFWPTDILGVVVSLRWLLLCKPWPMTHNSAPFINYYLMAHVAGMILYGFIAFFELVTQSIGNIALYVVPGFLLFTLMIWLVGFEPAKPKNMFF
ncbi:MAG: DUF4105 domain-containing protein [Gammaproteobacteria bacterium]|nr:DUF4105 domain-containing protein [Gammaproteobacteria bacterium]MDD9896876.1 DUF4105 domain-containing protein [Gammaproteobacteria bacterium]MDD9959884.1 DUF4105 domain-containing protein [Gammaproteobacteria bacterium]